MGGGCREEDREVDRGEEGVSRVYRRSVRKREQGKSACEQTRRVGETNAARIRRQAALDHDAHALDAGAHARGAAGKCAHRRARACQTADWLAGWRGGPSNAAVCQWAPGGSALRSRVSWCLAQPTTSIRLPYKVLSIAFVWHETLQSCGSVNSRFAHDRSHLSQNGILRLGRRAASGCQPHMHPWFLGTVREIGRLVVGDSVRQNKG